MNTESATLVAHCGAKKVTREELKEIPVPEGTRTHQPLPHHQIVDVLEEALSFRHVEVVKDEYAVSADGMKMFGVMDLNCGFDAGRFSIGLRNSNDKSMRLALTAGYRVFVCDNMAFSGDFTPLLHKHTRNFELRDSISIAVDRIHRGFDKLEARIASMKQLFLTDNDARLIIYSAFIEGRIKALPKNLLPLVHRKYFSPEDDAFKIRSLWSLSNAFTSAFKQLTPIKHFEVTARLGSYLNEYQSVLESGIDNGYKPAVDCGTDLDTFLPPNQVGQLEIDIADDLLPEFTGTPEVEDDEEEHMGDMVDSIIERPAAQRA